MEKEKILFLYPPTVYANHSMFKHFTYFGETVDVINRYYKNISVLDCAVEQIEQKVIFNNFKESKILIMEVEPYNIEVSLSLGKLYKAFNKNGKIIVYGTAITIMPNYFKKQKLFDYIISDGNFAISILSILHDILDIEYSYKNISKHYQLIDNEYVVKGNDFQLPVKDWGIGYNKLLPLDKYKYYNNGMFELTVQTGCPFNCSFCSEKVLFNKSCGTKYRDVEDIIKVIKNISSDFNEIYFSATTMTVNRKWTESLCNRLIEEKNRMPWRTVTRIDCVDEELLTLMKKAGLKKICFGVETFDDKLLEDINKNQSVSNVINILSLCNKLNIKAKALLMLGIPGQTSKSVYDTIKMLKELNVEYRFKEYSPIREAYILDSKNSDISDMIPIFSRYEYRSNSIPGISSEEYMELLFPTRYVR